MLNMIRSIRGILLIALVVSKSFIYIYHLPTKVFNETNMEKLINNYSFPLIYYGERFGKKMLYAISGFELTYIMACYFDNKNDSKHQKEQKEQEEQIEQVGELFDQDSQHTVKERNKQNESTQLNVDENIKSNINKELKQLPDDVIQNDDNEDKNKDNNKPESNNKLNQKPDEEIQNKDNIDKNKTINKKESNKESKEIKDDEIQNEDNVDNIEIFGNDQKKLEGKEEDDDYNLVINEYCGSQKKQKNLNDSNEKDQDDLNMEEKEENKGKVTTKSDTKESENVEPLEGTIYGDDNEKDYETIRKSLTIKDLIIWYSKHIYKYVLFILAIFLFKYGTMFLLIFQQISPMWLLYFVDVSKKFNYYFIFANICLFSAFRSKSFYWINPFVLVYNEITFFIIGSFLFYICYKYCFEMNRVILILFFFLLTTKIILGIFLFSSENFHYYPAMFYQYDNTFAAAKSYISSNQFMKLHIFLLGMFFGNVYYCLHNKGDGLENKRYLKLSLEFSKSKLFEFLEEGGCCPNFLQYIF